MVEMWLCSFFVGVCVAGQTWCDVFGNFAVHVVEKEMGSQPSGDSALTWVASPVCQFDGSILQRLRKYHSLSFQDDAVACQCEL